MTKKDLIEKLLALTTEAAEPEPTFNVVPPRMTLADACAQIRNAVGKADYFTVDVEVTCSYANTTKTVYKVYHGGHSVPASDLKTAVSLFLQSRGKPQTAADVDSAGVLPGEAESAVPDEKDALATI